MATPMIRAIRQQRPDWHISAITAVRATAEFAASIGEIDSVEHEDFLDYGLIKKARKLGALARRRYDYTILPYPAARWQYHLGALAMARGRLITHRYHRAQHLLIGYHFLAPLDSRKHVARLNLVLLRGLGLRAPSAAEYCRPRRQAIYAPLRRVALHLTSYDSAINKGNHLKAWPLGGYVKLARVLHSAGYEVAAVGSGAELNLADRLRVMAQVPVAVITGSLEDVAADLGRCAALVAHESGIAHLGAALGVPTVCLFGMTDPGRFAPLGNVITVRPSACLPCYDPRDRAFGCKRAIGYACLRSDLTLTHVLSALETLGIATRTPQREALTESDLVHA